MAKALLAFQKKQCARSQIVFCSINTAWEASNQTVETTIAALKEVYEVWAKLLMAKMASIVR
jgi:hypothetical protein